jgi:hypothetical protein
MTSLNDGFELTADDVGQLAGRAEQQRARARPLEVARRTSAEELSWLSAPRTASRSRSLSAVVVMRVTLFRAWSQPRTFG